MITDECSWGSGHEISTSVGSAAFSATVAMLVLPGLSSGMTVVTGDEAPVSVDVAGSNHEAVGLSTCHSIDCEGRDEGVCQLNKVNKCFV